jgi:benzoylformate decarboxylase
VFLSIPMDDADRPCLPVPAARTVTTRLAASVEQLAPVAAMLDRATSPVLILGGTVDEGNGWNNAVRLAERLNAPVWAPPEEGRPGIRSIAAFCLRPLNRCARSWKTATWSA